MIQITAYLRTPEDLGKWKSLKNKAGFLHDALQEIDSPKLPQIPRKANEPPIRKTLLKPQAQAPSKECPTHGPTLDIHGHCLHKGCNFRIHS